MYLGVAPLSNALPAEEMATRCCCGVSPFLQAQGTEWGSANSSVFQGTPVGMRQSGEYTLHSLWAEVTSRPLHTCGETECDAASTPSWPAASA